MIKMPPSKTLRHYRGLPLTGSPNTGYTAHFVRPNPDFVGASYSPEPLSSMPAAMRLGTAPNLRLATMRLLMVVSGLAITVPCVG